MKIGQLMTSQWRNKAWPTWICRFLAKHWPKSIFFAKKVPKIGISPGVLFIVKENGVSNMFCKFEVHIMQIFFKMVTLIFSGDNHPPVPLDFDGLPYPRVRGYPRILFHQNDRNGCKRDYLDARGHFVLHFVVIGDKPLKGGSNHPLRRRWLR